MQQDGRAQVPREGVSPAIRAVGLTKRYGDFTAVDRLDLVVQPGELFGFLGPNGSGKTTTIKMLTGLLEPNEGTAEVAGFDVWREPLAAKARFAYVPDEPNLFPKLTGREFLRFIGSVFRVPADVFERRSRDLLTLFDLTDSIDDRIETYSHGMRQKLAICAALVHDPEVIFLDEPTVGLDPRSARTLKTLLRRVCDSGATVFLTTHILEIAQQMCDRVGIIQQGKLIALGTLEELRERGGHAGASLEDIFLELTGGAESAELIEALAEGERSGGR
ncbi:ABC transporter ATP-binding protein [Sphaerobacter thermophilus]|uniref:ABC transporter related protein n=1 Tax=Sphaerobacter thermophilus (strain ATCC 49802 / DSM 20745 / KCCM 41009 / NCIMB 13125 / S 6022) TaxID=479434 RepID=D1C7A3_SPHTD|nr:ABC transporter ATP-binding protein [Sphaerobacter thermophilus]ACZ39749.1 ABC transporter related protein [Sphaerobacter thermophilus DSM 20745]